MTPRLAPVGFEDLTVPRATEGGKSARQGKAMEDKGKGKAEEGQDTYGDGGSSGKKNSVPNAGLNLLRPDSGCPLRAGTGHGRPGRAPGRCGCAVTSLLQRGFGGAVC